MPTTTEYTGCTDCCGGGCCDAPDPLYVDIGGIGVGCVPLNASAIQVDKISSTHWESSANPTTAIDLVEIDCVSGDLVLSITPSDPACTITPATLSGDCSPFLMTGNCVMSDANDCCTFGAPSNNLPVSVSE